MRTISKNILQEKREIEINLIKYFEIFIKTIPEEEKSTDDKLFMEKSISIARQELKERDFDILIMRIEGYTLQEIGKHFCLCRQRIREITTRANRIMKSGLIRNKSNLFNRLAKWRGEYWPFHIYDEILREEIYDR